MREEGPAFVDELHLSADLFNLLVLSLVVLDLLLFEVVAALGVDGDDQGTELLHAAVPEGLGHAQISPLSALDLFHRDGCHDCVACRDDHVDRSKVLTCRGGLFLHAALADDDADAGDLYELILELFHSHGRGRSDGDHLEFVVLQGPDDGACMQDRIVPDIYRDLTSFFHDTAVRHVAAGGQTA